MSSISSISSPLSSTYGTVSSSSTDDSDTVTKVLESTVADSVTLSNASLEMVESLFDSLGTQSTDSGDDSTDSMYSILLSAQNNKLLRSNPDLVEMMIATDYTDEESLGDIDLLSISSDDLLSIIEKYSEISSSTESSTTTSEVDETV
ncbi:MAG: hypothetical protein PVG49_22160 [Desulfobacteraceae bacterium]|jgi:hypothetical protein